MTTTLNVPTDLLVNELTLQRNAALDEAALYKAALYQARAELEATRQQLLQLQAPTQQELPQT